MLELMTNERYSRGNMRVLVTPYYRFGATMFSLRTYPWLRDTLCFYSCGFLNIRASDWVRRPKRLLGLSFRFWVWGKRAWLP